MRTLATLLCLLTLFDFAFSQTGRTASARQIDRYVKSIEKITGRRKEPDVIIADVSEYDTDVPKWKRFKSSKELETFRTTTETYTIANNWRTKGTIVASLFTFFSPSGDWAQYVTHYFRPDGSAAKVETEMRTFNGDYIIIRNMYFDTKGKLLKRTSEFLDLTSKKPKKPTPEMLDENSESYKADYYKKVSALPFYSLIRSNI